MTPELAGPAKAVVAVTNFGWSSVLLTITNLLIGGALVAWIKLRPKMAEIAATAEEKFVAALTERVTTVERQREEDRARYDAATATLEKKLEDERARHDAEVRLLRHRANNSDQVIDMMLMLFEDADGLPDRIKRAIASLKDMRTRQKQQEALEKGSMLGAQLAKSDVTTIAG